MIEKYLRITLFMQVFVITFILGGLAISAEAEKTPLIRIDQTTYTFPTVFEGKELSHTFAVYNRGTANLEIKKVTHSWGCFATHYDRVIPPGGTGKVTVKIDSNRVRGEFKKKAIVWSNDRERRSIALYLTGEVKPHISVEPGSYLGLWGQSGKVPAGHLDIINNHKTPMKITGIDNDRPERIKWRLKEIKPGFVYRLEVEDIPKTAANYTGRLVVRTDNPRKPELTIIVNGDIKEKGGS